MLQGKTEGGKNFTTNHSPLAGHNVETLPSMTELISPEQEKRFLKKLFAGDDAGYRRVLAQLEAFSNWSDAHHFLEDYFRQHAINPYRDEAVRFSDLVYRRYFPQDIYLYSVHEDFAQTDLRFLPFLQPAQ